VQLAQYRPPGAPTLAEDAAATPEQEAEREQRLDAILRQILAGEDGGFRPDSVLYQDFLVRLRIHEIGAAPDLPAFRRLLAAARAGIAPELAAGEAWQAALERARTLPEDAHGVFLLLARAALEASPCPSDAAIARAYGTHSASRARRLLSWMEERQAIVCRTERGGGRIVALVGLGWETGAGDPNGPAEGEAA
jgi:hypothetical protein